MDRAGPSGQTSVPVPVQDLVPASSLPEPDQIAKAEAEKNPVKKVTRKLKSVLAPKYKNQPSIRILRDSATGTKVAVPAHVADQVSNGHQQPPPLPLREGETKVDKTSGEYAEHFGAEARAHADARAGGIGGRIKALFGGGHGSGNQQQVYEVPEEIDPDEYDAETVDFLDVVGE
jgi:hypothetical protein